MGGTCCLRVRDDKFIGHKSLVGKCEGKRNPFEGQAVSRRTVLKRVLKSGCMWTVDLLGSMAICWKHSNETSDYTYEARNFVIAE